MEKGRPDHRQKAVRIPDIGIRLPFERTINTVISTEYLNTVISTEYLTLSFRLSEANGEI